MIVHMIATGSLSAFSAAALPQLPSQSARGVGGPGGVQQARSGTTPPQTQAAPTVPLDQSRIGAPQTTGRIPPRGSVLDLSV
jgi:hypothetical protein